MKPIRILSLLGMVLAASPLASPGTATAELNIKRPAAYDMAAMKLRGEAARKYEFNRAVLRDVLRFLADDAGLNYIALPEDEAAASSLVTFNIMASPFAALEMIAESHGVALIYEDGIWYMRPVDDHQLIGRSYQIRFNTGEVVTAGGAGTGGGGSSSGGFSGPLGGGGGGGGGGFGGGGGGQSGYYSPDLSLNNLGSTFQVNSEDLVKNVEKILGVQTRGLNANIAREANVGQGGDLQLTVDARVSPGQQGEASPQVIWNSDTNALFVVASRQQHQLVEAFLESVDRPQPLIAIEVKFFETGRDPRKHFGIDWSGVLNGYQLSASDLTQTVDLNDPKSFLWPQAAVLSGSDASIAFNAIVSDSDTRTVSYPRVLTHNNREAVIQSVVNEPVLSTESSTSIAAGGVQTASVAYLPIGTTINVLPKIMPDGNISMNVAVTVSSIIGNVVINGNPYPKATSRVYTAPLKVKSGFTAAIAGLEEADDSVSESGVPFLSKVPILGIPFRDRFSQRARKNLMIWITPYALSTDTEGLSEKPVSELPITQRDPLRRPPQIHANGEPVGGVDALRDIVLWADREQRRLEQIVKERRIDDAMSEDVGQLIRVCNTLIRWIDEASPRYPSREQELSVSQWSLRQIRRKTQQEDWKAFVKSDFY